MPGLDAWLYCCPYAGHVHGGDLHFVSSCWAGLLTRVVVADLTGEADDAQGTPKRLRRLMRRFTNFWDQSYFVSAVLREFRSLADSGGLGTAIVATYMAPKNRLVLSNAGHPPPLLYSAKTNRWTFMVHDEGQGTGAAPDGYSTRYDQFDLALSKGDAVILYTDSLIDATDRKGKPLGLAGLNELVQQIDDAEPAEFMHALLVAIGQMTGDPCENDDVTILLLKANDRKPPVSRQIMLKANLRLAGTIMIGALPGTSPIPWPQGGRWYRFGRIFGRIHPRWGPDALMAEHEPSRG